MPDILQISDPVTPPEWALLQRALIDAQSEAIVAFYEKYFDERGYLQCVPRWGGNDGPDDAAENMLNWTLLHALGAPDHVLDLYKIAWDGHLKQYTEAKTVDVENVIRRHRPRLGGRPDRDRGAFSAGARRGHFRTDARSL